MFLFKKKEQAENKKGKNRAEVFVDFEHWYISLDKQFSMRPDVRGFRDMIAEKYDIVAITFFGDFSNQNLREEIPRLREVSSKLIDTQNPSQYHKKDFTDFIMLDGIYQRAMSSDDIETFIIFTGDGHFNSVVSFLRTSLDKEVVIYGVKDATSALLKNSASSFILIPDDEEINKNIKKIIIGTVNDLYENKKNPRTTFVSVLAEVTKVHELDKDKVYALMNELIQSGYIYTRKKYYSKDRYTKILVLNKEKCQKDSLL